MRSKKKRRNQSKKRKRKRSRRKKGKGPFSSLRRKFQGKSVKGRIVGCDYFDANKGVNGNYNALPRAAFVGAMLCRAAYEYDSLFMHLLVFICNLKETQKFFGDLRTVTTYKDLIKDEALFTEPTFKARSMTDKFNPLALGKAIDKMNKRIAKPDTFNNKSAQYHGTLYNTALEMLAAKRSDIYTDRGAGADKDRITYWNPANHKAALGEIYTSTNASDAFDESDFNTTAGNLNFVMIQNSHDLNLYVAYDKKSNTIIVTFRGTASMASAKDDLKPLLHAHTTTSKDSDDDGMIHRGFGQQLKGSIGRIIHAMKYVYEKGEGQQNPKIFTCGHSLGGANVELFCYYYQTWIKEISNMIKAPYLNQSMTCVTWGAPRIGNKKFINKYNELLKDKKIILLRCTTDGDAIPMVPLEKMDYYHPGHGIDEGDAGSKYPHRYVCAHRLSKTLQLNYSKPLYCGERKWCDVVPSMVAHSNAAYVSFGGIGRTATLGSGLPSHTIYLRTNNYKGDGIGNVNLTKVKHYPDSDYAQLELYNKEFKPAFGANNTITINEDKSNNKPSFDESGARLKADGKFGTNMMGKGHLGRNLAMDIKSGVGRKLGSFANKVKNMNPRISPRLYNKKNQGTPVANPELKGGRRRRKKRTKKKARKKRRKSKRRR